MFTVVDEFGIYQAEDLDAAERILLSDTRPARLYLAETGKLIPHTVERRADGNLITYPSGIESIGLAPGSVFLKPTWTVADI